MRDVAVVAWLLPRANLCKKIVYALNAGRIGTAILIDTTDVVGHCKSDNDRRILFSRKLTRVYRH